MPNNLRLKIPRSENLVERNPDNVRCRLVAMKEETASRFQHIAHPSSALANEIGIVPSILPDIRKAVAV